jgi:hypothetical protein
MAERDERSGKEARRDKDFNEGKAADVVRD